eukprot:CAMPEP_0195028330 /NCGR_PEP_ID=MMETSP0326_2-20130528/54219_1 /TAXON_ID=2866 ORGANISM="Crypthecodinium cohnii, Strain Seligo" /NCGR_SAMPLE_ID=MMETSP0326_2 /ASSEMBLY_ACC=CAM_ASM_000348 /LENGTH=117 /DNA_ID=CAMNT_0040050815 /DNA_START=41 /DNA_END=392 /DNA_ORIENTATION=-
MSSNIQAVRVLINENSLLLLMEHLTGIFLEDQFTAVHEQIKANAPSKAYFCSEMNGLVQGSTFDAGATESVKRALHSFIADVQAALDKDSSSASSNKTEGLHEIDRRLLSVLYASLS